MNFVLYNQDLKNIHAVLAATVDFSKAFNRQNHNLLITLLSELGVPGWLLRIVIGFLQNRELEVKYIYNMRCFLRPFHDVVFFDYYLLYYR